MSRLRHYRRHKEEPELNVTTFLNLMVVLIPFLLITAVFSRMAIQELNLPEAAAGGSTPETPVVTIEVIVREAGLEIGDGRRAVAAFPKRDGSHDLERLSSYLLDLKRQYPDKEDATILIEPDVTYEEVIQVMDAVKVLDFVDEDSGEFQRFALFPELSIGDAP
jgi:biopolymer transport protein ExbD